MGCEGIAPIYFVEARDAAKYLTTHGCQDMELSSPKCLNVKIEKPCNNLEGGCCTHFTEQGLEAQRGLVNCPRLTASK